MKFNPHNTEFSDLEKWHSLCPRNEYRRVDATKLSGLVLSSGLLDKITGAVVMASGTGATDVVVANLFRLDGDEVDQQPFIGVWDHENKVSTGGFVDHGTWEDRTQFIGEPIFDKIQASGIAYHLPMGTNGTEAPSGLLTDLKESPNWEAWWNSIDMKKRKERGGG